jgi:hypothetical protein
MQTMELLYGNLKLGGLSNKVLGGERERLDFSASNYSRFGQMNTLYELPDRIDDFNRRNIDPNNQEAFSGAPKPT